MEMKLRIVIADDEAVILRGLKNCVEHLGNDFTLAGEAHNGKELLRIIEETRPHIVISDISMPEMTGLEVLEVFAEQPARPHFILISGYQEFEYARQAVALNAAAYLLKPVDEEALLQSVMKLKNQILGQKDWDAVLEAPGDKGKSFCVCALKADAAHRREILRLLSGRYDQVLLYREYVCILFDAAQFSHDLTAIHRAAKEALHRIEQELHVEVWGGLGNMYTGIGHIEDSFKEAKKALQYNYFSQQNTVYCIKDKAEFPPPDGEGFPAEMEAFLQSLRISDKQAAQETFHVLCAYIRSDSMGLKEIAAMKLYAFLEQVRRSLHHAAFETLYDETVIIQDLKSAERYTEATGYIWDLIYQLCFDPSIHRKKRDAIEIETIKAYIENHLSENIKLETIANMIYMNSYYFSVFFKKHAGINFKDFVVKVKMEKAYELVQNTDMRMYEIAEQIGVCDQKHFSNMFKKFFGITPTELRRKSGN